MWHILLDWLAIFFGVVGLLHFFFPKHGARMGDYILNTFAERSKAKTEDRIKKLEARLGHIEVLDILTDFQTILLHGISGILLILMLIPALILLAYVVAFRAEPPLSLIPIDMYRDSILLLALRRNLWKPAF